MKAHKSKIRATFYIDKKLYQLLKRCSLVEDIPMSSIINNEILEERVGKYEFETPEEWEGHLADLAYEEHNNEYEEDIEQYHKSPHGQLSLKKGHIEKLLADGRITEKVAKDRIAGALREFEIEYEKSLDEKERQEKEFRNKWIKAVSEIPLN